MKQAKSPESTELQAVVERLRPQQDRLARAWARFFAATSNGLEELGRLKASIAQVNRAVEAELPAIAQATGNSVADINLFRPSGIDAELKVWFDDHFPADFLVHVAQYRSFSVRYWKSRGWKGFPVAGSRCADRVSG